MVSVIAGNVPEYITPDWPAPNNVHAVFTTRMGGNSLPPWDSFNLGLHVGDAVKHVQQNRSLLVQSLSLPAAPLYLNQVHKTDVVCADECAGVTDVIPDADASWTGRRDKVVAIMTADCLPVLFASRCGGVVAGAHAGWRGLVDGVLEETIAALPVDTGELIAWFGPAIGPQHFEVGAEVRERFMNKSPAYGKHFVPSGASGKYLANLFKLAEDCLMAAGVGSLHGGGVCTYEDARRFYSYRRDGGQTGRMAALIWKS